jgi:hypothetical protein
LSRKKQTTGPEKIAPDENFWKGHLALGFAEVTTSGSRDSKEGVIGIANPAS